MAAYKAAIDDGADGFECDVRLTKDKTLVLWHDADLRRITGNKARIADLRFNELKAICPQVMSLEELLTLAKDNKKELAIETKHPVPTGSAVEHAVMDLIAQEKKIPQIYIMSFSWLALENIRKIDPTQKTVALLGNRFSSLQRRFTSATAIGPSISRFTTKPELQSDPRELFVWTVDDASDIRFCASNGVHVLITNNPSNARSVLGYH